MENESHDFHCVCDRERNLESTVKACVCVSACTIHIHVCVSACLCFTNAFRFLWTEASSTYLRVFVRKPRFGCFPGRDFDRRQKTVIFLMWKPWHSGHHINHCLRKKDLPLSINTILQKQSTTHTHALQGRVHQHSPLLCQSAASLLSFSI